MSFASVQFILLFLPIVVLVFYLVPASLRLPWLIGASLLFYGASGLIPLAFMLVSIAWGYGTAFLLVRRPGPWTLALAISVQFAILFLFKYLGFTLDMIGASDTTRGHFYFFLAVLLPAGISFYTFKVASYSIDVESGKIAIEKNPIRFVSYLAFFPHLIAGPILRYNDIRSQFARIATAPRLNPNFAQAFKLFSIGLFAKTFVADRLAGVIETFAEPQVNAADAAFKIFGYTFQIYYDFWAYSLMAIGLAKLFTVDLPINFNEPYRSPNPKEFWQRWHITLSSWIRDYIYMPLGKKLFGTRLRKSPALIAIITYGVTFLAVGIWHGAGVNFIFWGLYHAVLVLLYHFTARYWNRAPHVVQIATTFLLVSFAWPLFEADYARYGSVLHSLFSLSGGRGGVPTRHWILLAALAAATFMGGEKVWLYNETRAGAWWRSLARLADSPLVHATACVIGILHCEYARTFIYFRF